MRIGTKIGTFLLFFIVSCATMEYGGVRNLGDYEEIDEDLIPDCGRSYKITYDKTAPEYKTIILDPANMKKLSNMARFECGAHGQCLSSITLLQDGKFVFICR